MERGLYEKLVTEGLRGRLVGLDAEGTHTAPVDVADQPHVLARHVEAAVQRTLTGTRDPDRRLAIVNALLGTLEEIGDSVTDPATQLLSVRGMAGPGLTTYEHVRPATPLSEAALLTIPGANPASALSFEPNSTPATRWICSARS